MIDYYSEVIQFYFEYALNFRNLQKSFKKIKGDDFQNKTEKCRISQLRKNRSSSEWVDSKDQDFCSNLSMKKFNSQYRGLVFLVQTGVNITQFF